ncbi:MAG: endonuclease/exonuclease/phosphatase family protein [Pseudomonadota bacterium]
MSANDIGLGSLTLATYNIHSAIGMDRQFSSERIAEVIIETQADIIALQEVPLGGARVPDVLAYLKSVTGFFAVAGPTINLPQGIYGNAMLSKYPVNAVRTINLSFGRREPRGALDTDLLCNGHPLRVVSAHLGLSPAERRWQIRQLLETFDTEDMPVVLMGDINEWFVWGRPLRWLTSHFQQAPAPATFPSRRPIFSLDRIWIRPYHRLVKVRAHNSPLARIASDHLPLVAHIGD